MGIDRKRKENIGLALEHIQRKENTVSAWEHVEKRKGNIGFAWAPMENIRKTHV